MWALSRLSSIYGKPHTMFSDNARNFKGAENELKRVLDSWQSAEVGNYLTMKCIKWKFITSRAPNQGGLWEVAVKSAKHHLKRLIGNHNLTFEQLQTLFAKIAAVLNSRPFVPLSDNHTDLKYLMPVHVMTGEKLIQPKSTNLNEVPMN